MHTVVGLSGNTGSCYIVASLAGCSVLDTQAQCTGMRVCIGCNLSTNPRDSTLAQLFLAAFMPHLLSCHCIRRLSCHEVADVIGTIMGVAGVAGITGAVATGLVATGTGKVLASL